MVPRHRNRPCELPWGLRRCSLCPSKPEPCVFRRERPLMDLHAEDAGEAWALASRCSPAAASFTCSQKRCHQLLGAITVCHVYLHLGAVGIHTLRSVSAHEAMAQKMVMTPLMPQHYRVPRAQDGQTANRSTKHHRLFEWHTSDVLFLSGVCI